MFLSCGQHAGPCITDTTSEGVFCTVSGFELQPPEMVTHDFRQCCNPLMARKPAATQKNRRENALRRQQRRSLGPGCWRQALETLHGDKLSPTELTQWSNAIRRWSEELNVHRRTAPAMRQWALLFTATVTSKFECGKRGRVGTVVPKCEPFSSQAMHHTRYKKFGISCRMMSATWRKIVAEAMTDGGEVQKPFIAPSS